jgi:hypothetical protein
LAFESEAHCAVRVIVNYSAIIAIVGNAMVFSSLAVLPVSLKQVVNLDLPTPQLLAFCFYGTLLGMALALHGQNENFNGSVNPAAQYIDRTMAPCLILLVVSLAVSILRKSQAATQAAGIVNIEEGGGADRPAAVIVPAVGAAQYGTMIPYRIAMAAFTVIYLISQVCPVETSMRSPFGPLSFAAALFHIWIRAEEGSVGWPIKLHYFAHASESVIRSVRHLCDDGDDFESILEMVVYLAIMYQVVFMAATRLRSSVRSHGNQAAAKLAGVSCIAFWTYVCPVALYLGADSLGTFRSSLHHSCCVSSALRA